MGFLAIGQRTVFEFSKMNVAYTFISNPIAYGVEGGSFDSVTITTDNGKIDSQDGDGVFYFIPDHPGNANLKIWVRTINGIKFTETKRLRVYPLPLPTTKLAGRHTGELEAAIMRIQIAPSAYLEGFDIEAPARLVKYNVVVIRNNQAVFVRTHEDSKGCRFDNETRTFFSTLQPGDKVWINDIHGRWGDSQSGLLDDIFIKLF
ncbi:MAG: hypothetical protein IAE95_00760 [Chitinophagaceae bacterium]|nr:hypothetical protein [Chitinophagaceae bacterium]